MMIIIIKKVIFISINLNNEVIESQFRRSLVRHERV